MLLAVVVLRVSDADTTRAADNVVRVGVADLGKGIVLSHNALAPGDVLLGECWSPVPIEFVEPMPHGRDHSLVEPRKSDDRVFYVYRGWIIGGRFAPTALSVLDLVARASWILGFDRTAVPEALAIKFIVPAGCHARPEDALAALRREALLRR